MASLVLLLRVLYLLFIRLGWLGCNSVVYRNLIVWFVGWVFLCLLCLGGVGFLVLSLFVLVTMLLCIDCGFDMVVLFGLLC